MDSPVTYDTEKRYKPHQLPGMIVDELSAHKIIQFHLLIFESMSNDALNLRDTIIEAQTAFGYEVIKSVVIMITKENLAYSPTS
jgi:hypothetical protein